MRSVMGKINNLRLIGAALTVVLVLGATSCGGGGQGSGDGDSVVLGTAGAGGTYYFVGQGVANVLQNNTDIRATAQATAGGIENIRRVASGDMDLGLIRTLDVRTTTADDTVDVSDVRVIGSNHAIAYHMTVGADSDIETLDQLFAEGNRIGTGEPGSSIQGDAKDMLAVYDLTMDDINSAPIEQSEQARALQDGTLDGTLLPGGVPVASVSEIASTVGARVLPATDEFLDAYKEYQPDVFSYKIPGGTYDGIERPVRVFAIPALLVVRADMPEDAVYEITKTIQQNTEGIARVHPSGKEFSTEDAFRGAEYYTQELGLKFHDGAIRWYEEQGAWDERYK